MVRLQDIKPNMHLTGIRSGQSVEIRAVFPSPDALLVMYRTQDGTLSEEYLYARDEAKLDEAAEDSGWDFTGDGEKFRYALEAERIRLAHLFDPYLALSTSSVEPLPHQIAAVYQEMLPRLPLRYVLADDPGAGKTIMTGLLIKELALRGALERCLIVCPGNLVEQWQDELEQKFGLHFAILGANGGSLYGRENPFEKENLLIARLDALSRTELLKNRLQQTRFDLIVCDEAHKMSATISGKSIRATKRHKLGELLSDITENLLLLTATPHNGKEADFQLFMSLIDRDRFDVLPGRPLAAVDVSDVMRRLVKEDLLQFDGRPLFPPRVAASLRYELSPPEQALYDHVTQYVREQFNRADRLENDRRNTVGFALMVLQRRLASSPEAIYQSLRRRRTRLESRRADLTSDGILRDTENVRAVRMDDLYEGVLSSSEAEEQEENLVDGATAARTAAELEAEITILRGLEREAEQLRRSEADQKWCELRGLLEEIEAREDASGRREKLIVFTEHKDTIWYLKDLISRHLGRPEAVTVIHGGLNRRQRKQAEEEFRSNPDVQILLATDAAGEGVNLQCAHLVVNYDLPWNPNRIEQRFGRVHRIGQEHVCYLWNLVSAQTREGRVYDVLLEKLSQEQQSLPGKVFDVLGDVRFGENTLRELLVEAIRSDSAENVERVIVPRVEQALRTENLLELVRERALSGDAMDLSIVLQIREEMERIEARRLQPHFIEAFAVGALRALGGRVMQREHGRYEISRMPAAVREENLELPTKFERICFEKNVVRRPGLPDAQLITPDHALLKSIIRVIQKQYADTLEHGAVLIDDTDPGIEPRLLFSVQTTICDGDGSVCSQQVKFVEMREGSEVRDAGPAPYLDYRPASPEEAEMLRKYAAEHTWNPGGSKATAQQYAVQHILQKHRARVEDQTQKRTERVRTAVTDRLTQEMMYLRRQRREKCGFKTDSEEWARITKRISEIEARQNRRLAQLDRDCELHAQNPQVTAGAVILPRGLVDKAMEETGRNAADAQAKRSIELTAMEAVVEIERSLGYSPRDVSAENVGYDIESSVPESRREPGEGVLRFIEVKGRAAGSDDILVTKNEILTALNSPDQYILAVVEVDGDTTRTTYIMDPFHSPPDFGATSVGYSIRDLKKNGRIIREEERTSTYA